MSLSAQLLGGRPLERLELDPAGDRVDPRRDGAGAVLEQEAVALAGGAVAEPAERGAQLARGRGRVLDGGDQLAAREVDLVLQPDRHAQRRLDLLGGAVGVAHLGHARAGAGRQDDDLVARLQRARGEPARGPARAALAAQHELHRQPRAVHGRRLDRDRLQALQQRRAGVPGHVLGRARRRCRRSSALIGMNSTSCRPTAAPSSSTSRTTSSKRSSAKSTRSILLTATITWRIRSSAAIVACRRDCSVRPGAGVDQQQREVGGRRARDHVARVLRVAGAVGEDEAPLGRGERAVGDVDRDALLALGAQAVGEQREVEPVDRALLDVGELVGQHGLGVVEQAADQGRLAVVDASRRWRGASRSTRSSPPSCGPPWRPRDARSSARVSPRSVMLVAAISATTSGQGGGGRSAPRPCSSCRRPCGSARTR